MNTILFTASIATLTCGLLFQDPSRTNPNPQNPPNTQDRADGRMPGQDATAPIADQVLITWLTVDNENEVAFARIALQKAQSAEVKQFAQQMIDDHSKMVQKLNGMSGTGRAVGDARTGETPRAGEDRTGGTRPGDTPRPSGATREATAGRDTNPAADASGGRVMGSTGSFDHERLIRDLGRKCQDSHTKMLQEKQGSEFDRCYMGMAVAAHVGAVDKLEVFRSHASPTLRPMLDEALPVVRQHLQHAKELAKKTDDAKTAMGTNR